MGFVGDALKGVGKAVGGVAKGVLGNPITQAGVGLIPGVGPIASTALGALGGGLGGGGVEGALGGAARGFGAQQLMQTFRQQQEDAARARELVNQGVDLSQQGADIAMQQFNETAPMRQGFQQGALNFHDQSNPFAQQLQLPSPQPAQMMQPQMQMQPQQQPQPGSISQRVSHLLDRGSETAPTRRASAGNRGDPRAGASNLVSTAHRAL